MSMASGFTGLLQRWHDLRIGVRLTIGVGIILLLTLIVGLVGWRTLESQSRSQILANQAIDLVSALRAARQDEKNYMLYGNEKHVEETLQAIEQIRHNAESLLRKLPESERPTMRSLLSERDSYQREFESFVRLNRQKEKSLEEMVIQGRNLENAAITLRDDQKKELLRLEALAVSASKERQEKSEKADDANRMIKLMGEARQQEKNFLLRGDFRYADATESLVNKLIILAKSTQQRFEDPENKALAGQIVTVAGQYLAELEKVREGRQARREALENIVRLGRLVEDQTRKLREDQKQELIELERQGTDNSVPYTVRLDKREKADAANRIIKLMGEARQQEKNFLLRKAQAYADMTRDLVNEAMREAQALRERFQDKQNRELADRNLEAFSSLDVDAVVVNTKMPPNDVLKRYVSEGQEPVVPDVGRISKRGINVYAEDLIGEQDSFVRHDPDRLTNLILRIGNEILSGV